MYDEQPLIEPLYFEQQLQLLDQLKKFEEKYQVEIKNFFLTGGDPFCHPNFENLLNELSKRGKKISILGIPERLTDKTGFIKRMYL